MTFKPGQSGNPSGVRKAKVSVVRLARKYTQSAVNTLHEIMTDPRAMALARVKAADILLDRAWGKAPQAIALATIDGGNHQIARDALAALLATPVGHQALAAIRQSLPVQVIDMPGDPLP